MTELFFQYCLIRLLMLKISEKLIRSFLAKEYVCVIRAYLSDRWVGYTGKDREEGSAGFGFGSDSVDHRIRRGASLPHIPRLRHGVLRGRHIGLGRRTLMARDAPSRRACRRLRDTGYTEAGPEGVSSQVGGHMAL